MTEKIIIIPSPIELKYCASVLSCAEKFQKSQLTGYRGKYCGEEILLIKIGIGEKRALKNIDLILKYFSPAFIILFGACGSISPDINIGDIVYIKSVISLYGFEDKLDALSGINLSPSEILIPFADNDKSLGYEMFKYVRCMSLNKAIASQKIRDSLFKKFNREIVDFETYAIAKRLIEEKIKFFAFRIVTDNACEDAIELFKENVKNLMPLAFKQILNLKID